MRWLVIVEFGLSSTIDYINDLECKWVEEKSKCRHTSISLTSKPGPTLLLKQNLNMEHHNLKGLSMRQAIHKSLDEKKTLG